MIMMVVFKCNRDFCTMCLHTPSSALPYAFRHATGHMSAFRFEKHCMVDIETIVENYQLKLSHTNHL